MEIPEKPTLKKIRYVTRKKDFIVMYFPETEKVLLDEINEIIFNNRKDKQKYQGKTKRNVINTKSIYLIEFKEFVKNNCLPVGWEF
jgi:hypothetical protein